jgi:hypothetical protein
MLQKTELENLISQAMRALESSNYHTLDFTWRVNIYKMLANITKPAWPYSFELSPSVPKDPANTIINRLACLTTRKVLQAGESADTFRNIEYPSYLTFPHQILEVSENFLAGKLAHEEAELNYKGDFYMMQLHIRSHTRLNTISVVDAAYTTLGSILYGLDNMLDFDFAGQALLAYAGVDQNPPGVWRDAFINDIYSRINVEYPTIKPYHDFATFDSLWEVLKSINLAGLDLDNLSEVERHKLKTCIPFTLDTSKSREFWAWWLSEAVPYAWEQAQFPYKI